MIRPLAAVAALLSLFLSNALLGEEPSAVPPFHVGVCAHFGQNKGIAANNLAMMRAAGITSLRDELSWGGVERQRGRYAIPADKAAAMRRAAELGIAPMLIFDYANRLYDDGDRPRSPQALDGYAGYAEALVEHFGESVRLYEVWNEYDIGIGMPEPYRQGGSPEDYVAMLRHVYPRLKKLDPGVQVIGGAITSGAVRRGWLEEALKLGMLDCCDVMSIHTYHYSAPGLERSPEAWHTWMIEVQEMAKRYNDGRAVPTYVTEMGWPTHQGKPNSTPAELSASYLGRLYLLARTLPFMRGIWWYDFQDDGWDPAHNEHNFGLVRPDLTPKPSYYVMADVAPLAAAGEYLGRVETGDEHLRVLRFRLDDEELWVAWSADNQPRQLRIETGRPEKPLVIHQLGHRPIARGWGYRPWAKQGGRTPLIKNQATLIVADRPWLLRGGMDGAKLVGGI